MSAIAGLWSFDGKTEVTKACQSMLEALSIYGRDACDSYSSPSLAMGRCLLRLLPQDRFDTQPLSSNGVTALVADLRLDNRAELARDLDIGPAEAEAMADSQILLLAWNQWGEDCVDHLTGAFSFALWNERDRHLLLARDQTGERPLFYSLRNNCFAFASMPKGLHALPFIPAEIDEEYVAHYLTLAYIPVERTIFHNMERLKAGCVLSVRPGKVQLRQYWQPERLSELRLRSDAEYLDLFRRQFDDAVSARLRTVGGIGAQLSGGLDSASVTATAARLLADRQKELTCFTAIPRSGFTDAGDSAHFNDEGPAAAEVAALYPNIRHERVDSEGVAFLDILDLNNGLYDHPCFGPSNEVWSNAVMSQAQRKGITVLLNGNCGNATFSYDGAPALSALFRSGRWPTLLSTAWHLRRTGNASSRSLIRNAFWPSLPFWLRSITDPHMRSFSLDYSILHPAVAKRRDLKRRAFRDLNEVSSDGRSILTTLLQFGDVSETSIASQAGWNLDFRDPTFDRRIVEFCLTVPVEQFLRGGRFRSLARRAMEDRLPSSTVTRSQRGRQSADWYVRLGELRARMSDEIDLLQQSPLANRLLDLPRMRSLVEHWPSQGFERPEICRSYHIALTRGFSVGRFLSRYDPDAPRG